MHMHCTILYMLQVSSHTFQTCSHLKTHNSGSQVKDCLHGILQGQTVKIMALCLKRSRGNLERNVKPSIGCYRRDVATGPPFTLEGCHLELTARNKLLAVKV